PKGTCFHCGVARHWRRNCAAYIETAKHKKLAEASGVGIDMFMIEINLSYASTDSWVLDTSCGSHICNNLQGLRDSRRV
ncbi:hypothetical protein L2V44_14265, partial [Staphylococcus aureus]|nr:hypothetical protein [Staphylococcus aureus]